VLASPIVVLATVSTSIHLHIIRESVLPMAAMVLAFIAFKERTNPVNCVAPLAAACFTPRQLPLGCFPSVALVRASWPAYPSCRRGDTLLPVE